MQNHTNGTTAELDMNKALEILNNLPPQVWAELIAKQPTEKLRTILEQLPEDKKSIISESCTSNRKEGANVIYASNNYTINISGETSLDSILNSAFDVIGQKISDKLDELLSKKTEEN